MQLAAPVVPSVAHATVVLTANCTPPTVLGTVLLVPASADSAAGLLARNRS